MKKQYIIKCESYRMFYSSDSEDYIKNTKYKDPTYFVFDNEGKFLTKLRELETEKDIEEFNIWWAEENINYKKSI